jgi:hypothetical protein
MTEVVGVVEAGEEDVVTAAPMSLFPTTSSHLTRPARTSHLGCRPNQDSHTVRTYTYIYIDLDIVSPPLKFCLSL